MSLTLLQEPVRFHLSLNVPDLSQAVRFYSLFFGMEPTKRHDDYSKFDLTDPPVVFSLVPLVPGPGATLSHLGLRVSSDEIIQQYRERLEANGVCCETQEGTVCGYAKQNKLWVRDPFGNFWEVYRIEEDVRPELIRKSVDGQPVSHDTSYCDSHPNTLAATWEHHVAHPFPERIPHEEGTIDEVRLTGTFNTSATREQIDALLAEAIRILKPGGKAVTHGLMADRPFAGVQPKLPGLAAMVARVPLQTLPSEALQQAGFVDIRMVKYTEKAWFTHEGAELREVKYVARKPAAATQAEPRQLLYKGPFAQATLEGGLTLPRGTRTTVPAATWERLRSGPGAEQFLFIEPEKSTGCGV